MGAGKPKADQALGVNHAPWVCSSDAANNIDGISCARRQILAVVAGEGAAWTLIGSIAGLRLGLLVAVVLVHVVNPQSFHWTMDLITPWLRLLALCTAVVIAGTLTAWLAGSAAAGKDAVLAVKEDW